MRNVTVLLAALVGGSMIGICWSRVLPQVPLPAPENLFDDAKKDVQEKGLITVVAELKMQVAKLSTRLASHDLYRSFEGDWVFSSEANGEWHGANQTRMASDGRYYLLTSPDGRKLDKPEQSGRWKSTGRTVVIREEEAKAKDSVLTLTEDGKHLLGMNFDGVPIRARKMGPPTSPR